MPAAAASGATVLKVLARQNFGRRHQRGLPAAFDHGRRREQGHHGLARSHIALQQPQHALGLGEIGDDVGDGAPLRGRERIGQRLDQLFPDMPGALRRPAGGPPQMRAHQRERQLTRQKLVVGKPRPGQSFRQQVDRLRRPVQDAQRLSEGREALACNPTGLLPFRQVRQARERGIGGFAHLVEAQPFGQRINRLDQRQLREIRLRDDAVGMHHLPHMVVECDRARYVAPLADRQQLLQVILARIEISQHEIAGLIAGVNLIGHARPVRRRRPVAIHGDRDGDDGIGHHVAQLRPRSPVDRAGGQVKQEIDHPRRLFAAEQPAVELLQLRPDAGQRRDRSEQRIEQARPHSGHLAFRRRRCSRGWAG